MSAASVARPALPAGGLVHQRHRAARCRVAAVLLALAHCLPTLCAAQALPAASAALYAPPSNAEVEYYTRPQIRARLHLPKSLQNYRVSRVLPSKAEPGRFDVEVQFRAKTPFGGLTSHKASFSMKRGSAPGIWIVTAQ